MHNSPKGNSWASLPRSFPNWRTFWSAQNTGESERERERLLAWVYMTWHMCLLRRTKDSQSWQTLYVGTTVKRISVDVMGPLLRMEKGNWLCLSCYGLLHHMAWSLSYVKLGRNYHCWHLGQWLHCPGVSPRELHSNEGRNFESFQFQEMWQILGIKKTRTTALHPQSGGINEV